jgi:murein DD-endopeptidase MepM/ murein hydrolase activator NlpD
MQHISRKLHYASLLALSICFFPVQTPPTFAASEPSASPIFESGVEHPVREFVEDAVRKIAANSHLKLISRTHIASPGKYELFANALRAHTVEPPQRDRGKQIFTARFDGPLGSPLYSLAKGKVLYAGWCGGYGRAVIIRYEGSYLVGYFHLRRLSVATNQFVEEREKVAELGASGFTSSSKLTVTVTAEPEAWKN